MTQYSSYEMWHGEYSSIVFLELENWLSALQFPCIFLMEGKDQMEEGDVVAALLELAQRDSNL